MENMYKIDWSSEENKESLINATVNEIVLKIYKEKHPDVVEKIKKLVEQWMNDA